MSDELSKLDAVLARLEDVREAPNGGYRARCPVHGGRSADDLGIRVGSKWINLNCFAGCEYDAIRVALSLDWKDLVVDEDVNSRRRPVSQRQRELTAMACCLRLANEPAVLERLRFGRGWAKGALELLSVGWDGARLTLPVRAADGKLHDTLRYDPFTRVGRKVLAGKGKSRLPWPAPESIAAPIAFVVEGEGTAISMLSVGLRAVSLPGSIGLSTNVVRPARWQGAGWHKTWARRFEHFKHVVLLPDLDGPGRALMGAARYDLDKAGIPVSIVDLGPETHDGSDVADMLLSKAFDGDARRQAKELLRTIVAEKAEVLVAA